MDNNNNSDYDYYHYSVKKKKIEKENDHSVFAGKFASLFNDLKFILNNGTWGKEEKGRRRIRKERKR